MVNARKATLSMLGFALLGLTLSAGCGNDEAQTRPYVDAHPPEIPMELIATRSADGAIRLYWAANSVDPDLAGYVIYRSSSPDRGYQPVNLEPVATNAFVDVQAQGTKGYWYSVSSRDVHENESARSENTHVGPRDDRAQASSN